jgi:hypothetical protein
MARLHLRWARDVLSLVANSLAHISLYSVVLCDLVIFSEADRIDCGWPGKIRQKQGRRA